MNLNKIQKDMERDFFIENNQILFWFEPGQYLEDELTFMSLSDIRFLSMSSDSTLEIKLRPDDELTLNYDQIGILLDEIKMNAAKCSGVL